MTGFGDLDLKFSLILGISVFMSMMNIMLSRIEDEKSFINLEGPGWENVHTRGCHSGQTHTKLCSGRSWLEA